MNVLVSNLQSEVQQNYEFNGNFEMNTSVGVEKYDLFSNKYYEKNKKVSKTAVSTLGELDGI